MVRLQLQSTQKIKNKMTLQQAQKKVDDWIVKYGARYFNELTNFTLLTEEIGEMARIMAREYGEQSYKESDKGKSLEEEIGDVLFVLICIANQTNFDLGIALDKSITKKTHRDTKRHFENEKLK